MTQTMFSSKVITPGTTRTSDLVWWWRQRVNDLGLDTWFQPSVDVQRKRRDRRALGDDPVIQPGDRAPLRRRHHRRAPQHRHAAPGATCCARAKATRPKGCAARSPTPTRCRTSSWRKSARDGPATRSSTASRARMDARKIDGTIYSHPIGLHGHGAGPLIGLWDYQDGVPGRGDAKVIPSMWWSIELQATTPVPEWSGQAGPHGAGRGRDRRRGREGAVGAAPAGQAVPGPVARSGSDGGPVGSGGRVGDCARPPSGAILRRLA